MSATGPTSGGGAEREPWRLAAAEIAARVGAGELSAVAVAEACLERTERVEPLLGAYLEIDRDGALERAEAVDRRVRAAREAGEPVPTLAGVPVALKDNLSVAGRPLTCGARILEGYVAPFTATTVERLLAAGAVRIGVGNTGRAPGGGSRRPPARPRPAAPELGFHAPGRSRPPAERPPTPSGCR